MERKNHHHIIDFLFPITLFLLFASLAITIILLATNIYRETAEHSYYSNNARLSLSYLSEKVKHHNRKGNISLETSQDHNILVITHPDETDTYYTYIYYEDGYLKELFVKEGVEYDFSFSIVMLYFFTQIGER